EARALAEDALDRQRQVLGKDHAETLRAMADQGMILFRSGNPFGGRKLLEQSLAGYKKALGMHHPNTKNVAQALSTVTATFGGSPKRGNSKAPNKRDKGKKHRP